PAHTVFVDDIEEARKRLGALRLGAGMSPQREIAALEDLGAELVRLVMHFPLVLLGQIPIPPSAAGANAPKLNLTLMEQLLLLALDPYFARVLGLYFVDTTAQPGVKYDYAIVGLWGSIASQNPVVEPGLAAAAPLARGSFAYNGLNIQAASNGTTLWRWLKFDPNGNYSAQVDPTAPSIAGTIAASAIAGIPQNNQPNAMLMAVTQSGGWGFAPPPLVTFSLNQPAQAVDVAVAGSGTVQAFSSGTVIATANFSSSQLTVVNVAATSLGQPIDQIVVSGTGGWLAECIAIALLRMYPVGAQSIGTQYAIIHAPGPIHLPAAPGDPITTYRRRHADIEPASLTLVPHSLYDVVWPAPNTAAQQIGNPISDPAQLPHRLRGRARGRCRRRQPPRLDHYAQHPHPCRFRHHHPQHLPPRRQPPPRPQPGLRPSRRRLRHLRRPRPLEPVVRPARRREDRRSSLHSPHRPLRQPPRRRRRTRPRRLRLGRRQAHPATQLVRLG